MMPIDKIEHINDTIPQNVFRPNLSDNCDPNIDVTPAAVHPKAVDNVERRVLEHTFNNFTKLCIIELNFNYL